MTGRHESILSIASQHGFYVDLLSPQGGERILDAGCGRGATLRVGLETHGWAHWNGVDYSEAAARQASSASRGGAAIAAGDLRWLPYAGSAFDCIVSRDTLECIPEPSQAIDEMVRVLRPGGRLLLCHWDWYSQHFQIRDRELAREMVQAFAETQQDWMEALDPAMGRKLMTLAGSAKDIEILDAGILQLVEREWADGRFGYEQSLGMSDLLRRRGKITREESESWHQGLRAAGAGGSYAYHIDHYWVLARKRTD